MDAIHLIDQPIQPERYRSALADEEHGAQLEFAGVVRRTEGATRLRGIDYQAYAAMAESELEKLLAEAHREWGTFRAVIVHRTGEVPVGDASVWIGVGCGHRDEAYAISRFLIDQLKARVPIWKREHLGEAG